jgi:tripartite-type tricarboxylate transporter receptor subunit TctC
MRSTLKIKTTFPAVAGLAVLSLALAGCGGGAAAKSGDKSADYPSKPVTFLMPYAAGGPSDVTSRTYASCLGESLGGTFVVENQPSGAGAVAMQELAAAKPDGYTLGLSTNGPMVLNPMVNSLPYTQADFTAVGTMAEIPTMFAVGAKSPYKDAQALLQAAKKNPGKISIGVPGATSSLAIELQRLKKDAGIEFAVVPTTGSAELITNLLGGHVNAVFINDHEDVAAQIKDGAIIPIAAASEERSKAYPDLPTLGEVGYPGVYTSSIYALFGPKNLPAEIVAILEKEVEKCSQDRKVIETIGERFVPDEFSNAAATTAVFTEMKQRYEPLLAK